VNNALIHHRGQINTIRGLSGRLVGHGGRGEINMSAKFNTDALHSIVLVG